MDDTKPKFQMEEGANLGLLMTSWDLFISSIYDLYRHAMIPLIEMMPGTVDESYIQSLAGVGAFYPYHPWDDCIFTYMNGWFLW